MIINHTTLRIDPSKVEEFIAAIHGPKTVETFQKYGMLFTYVLQSKEDPEKVISVSGMEDTADLEAIAQSSEYAAVVAAIKPYLTAPPKREVLEKIAELEI